MDEVDGRDHYKLTDAFVILEGNMRGNIRGNMNSLFCYCCQRLLNILLNILLQNCGYYLRQEVIFSPVFVCLRMFVCLFV